MTFAKNISFISSQLYYGSEREGFTQEATVLPITSSLLLQCQHHTLSPADE